MRFYLATAFICATGFHVSSAFVPSHCGAFSRHVCLDMTKKKKNSSKKKQSAKKKAELNAEKKPEPKKKLTSADIINRARQASGMPELEDEAPPKIFEDDLLDDMRQSLLTLEKRVSEGAGSLTADEVEDFESRMKRVVDEMNEKLGIAPTPQPQAVQVASTVAQPQAVQVSGTAGYGTTDISNDEGPAYDGTGGMGVARGTRNTYVIPGMEEMTPEEYRKALQDSVSNRQTRRKGSLGGVVGNRAAHQYLDQLGAGGSAKYWKPREDDEEED